MIIVVVDDTPIPFGQPPAPQAAQYEACLCQPRCVCRIDPIDNKAGSREIYHPRDIGHGIDDLFDIRPVLPRLDNIERQDLVPCDEHLGCSCCEVVPTRRDRMYLYAWD